MYTRNGIKMDGDCPINLSEVMIGDIITVESQSATTRKGNVMFDEFTGVIYQINPDGSAMAFSWNYEAFATIKSNKVMLNDHNPRSATKASKFRYNDNPVLASECKFGHEVYVDGNAEYILIGRTKCGNYWNAYDIGNREHQIIPLNIEVTILDRDVLLAKATSKWMMKS